MAVLTYACSHGDHQRDKSAFSTDCESALEAWEGVLIPQPTMSSRSQTAKVEHQQPAGSENVSAVSLIQQVRRAESRSSVPTDNGSSVTAAHGMQPGLWTITARLQRHRALQCLGWVTAEGSVLTLRTTKILRAAHAPGRVGGCTYWRLMPGIDQLAR